MGLDNYPHAYPCKTQGSAVLDEEGRIDCKVTQGAGGCPWQNDPDRPKDGSVIGMFGTDCWYRGKYGNWLVQFLVNTEETFYGDQEDATFKSPQSCLVLADLLKGALVELPDEHIRKRWFTAEGGFDEETVANPPQDRVDGVRHDLKYAEWYLRWAATHCGGLTCWY